MKLSLWSKDGPKEKPGKGSVHHIAIRVKDGEELREWNQRIQDFGFEVYENNRSLLF